MSNSKIFDKFKGSLVHIATKSLKGSESSNGSKIIGPVVIQGFLLDECDTYFYLGDVPDEITDAVLKEEVVRMCLPTMALMDMLPGSEFTGDLN